MSEKMTVVDESNERHLPQHVNNNSSNPFAGLTVRNVSSTIFDTLKPDIFSRRKGPTKRIGPTAWLDGLRGWAAFSVCMVHLTVYTHPGIELCYGYDEVTRVDNTTPIAFPLIRPIFSGGHFSVMLFFSISGYVLTKRLLSLIHEGPARREEFLESVNSALVRRPFRLFLPVVWSTLTWAIIWHLTGIAIPWPTKQPNIVLELFNWVKETLKFFYFFRGGFLFTLYNIHTWTIPVELRGSMVVYVWCFIAHQFAIRTRVLLTLLLTLYFNIASTGSWYAAFLAGMLTCELDLISDGALDVNLPWDGIFRTLRKRPIVKGAVLHFMLFGGLYLASIPSSDWMTKEQVLGTCPGWVTLGWIVPSVYNDKGGETDHRWFWLFWGAWMMLVAVKEITWVRKLFESGPAQYLGKVSFALYLVHGPMIGMVSERLFYITGVKTTNDSVQLARFGHLYNTFPISGNGPIGLEPNFLVCVFISLIVFLYVAEVGTKMWDGPSVKVAKWVYQKIRSWK